MLTELEPCPFCGEHLETWGVNYRHSLDSECVLANVRVTPTDIDAWNRRAASAAPAEGREASDAAILALNEGERYFSETPTRFPEAGHGTQYHAGAPGVIGFARAVIALATAPTVSEADTKDAKRYRWLQNGGICELPYDDHGLGAEFDLDSWDAEIDERIDRAAAKGESDE
jgi:hypothetical protein